MVNLLSYASVLPAIIAVGDTTNLTVPAVAAGVGVGAIAVALFARSRNKDDGKSDKTPPTQNRGTSKHMK